MGLKKQDSYFIFLVGFILWLVDSYTTMRITEQTELNTTLLFLGDVAYKAGWLLIILASLIYLKYEHACISFYDLWKKL